MSERTDSAGGRTCIFTIASRNYTHATRTLMAGVAAHAPGAHRLLALCDERGDFDFSGDPFEVLDLSAIKLPDRLPFLFQYTLLELNTAIKPFVIDQLFESGFDKVIYFDPDIAVLSSLDDMLHRLDDADLLLTPHITAPIDDGHNPDELSLLVCGTYNLGFAGFRRTAQTLSFVRWWQRKLAHDCVVDKARGLFVDQKWMEFGPSFCARTQVVRHPGWNAAYWNLPHRVIEEKEGRFTVNGEPLVFYHFSGCDPVRGIFGKHQDRYTVESLPAAVRKLVESYGAEWRRHGYPQTRDVAYAHACFADGTAIPDLARKIFREQRSEIAGRFPDPAGADAAAFMRFLNEPFSRNGRSSPLVTRLLWEVYGNHPELALATQFPDVLGLHAESFARWCMDDGRTFHRLPDPFLAPVRAALDARTGTTGGGVPNGSGAFDKWLYQTAWRCKNLTHAFIPLKTRQKIAAALFRRAYVRETATTLAPTASAWQNRPEGLNVVGYLRAELGVGEAARTTLRACAAAGVPAAAIDFTKGTASRLGEAIPPGFRSTPDFGVTLLSLNAEQIPYAVADCETALQDRYTIACWNWELPELPDSWLESTRFLREVWAPSQFCQVAFSRKLQLPVTHVPYAIDVKVPEGVGRRELGLPDDGFLFLYIFDAFSVPERKNPLAVVEAYRQALPSFRRKTYLVLKMSNADKESVLLGHLQKHLDQEPTILPMARSLRRPELNALFQAADAYVSLHRSEGFGLTLAESMFLGKPVIATGWSANMDFMTPWNSMPVPYRLVQLERDFGPYPQGQWWADPDTMAAASAMTRLVNEPELARQLGAQARQDIGTHYAPATVGRIIAQRLHALRRT